MANELLTHFLEQQHMVNKGKPYLFKGVNPQCFRYYFLQNGIGPGPNTNETEPWVTNDWRRATEYARVDPIYKNGPCFAIFADPEGEIHKHFSRRAKSGTASLFGHGLYEMAGKTILPFTNLLALITTSTNLEVIHTQYMQSPSQQMTWDEFSSKVVLVEPQNPTDFYAKLFAILETGGIQLSQQPV